MSTYEKLIDWLQQYRIKHGEDAKVICCTKQELNELYSTLPPACFAVRNDQRFDYFADTEVETTHYAEQMRLRTITIPFAPLQRECRVSEFAMRVEPYQYRDYAKNELVMGIRAHVLCETTHVEVTHEWDYFAWLKRLLRVTKRFPIKSKKVKIDGRVIYPYLKVSLPGDKHVVKLSTLC
jgi:hypothetical protein